MDEQTHDELRRAVDAQLAKADQNRIAGRSPLADPIIIRIAHARLTDQATRRSRPGT